MNQSLLAGRRFRNSNWVLIWKAVIVTAFLFNHEHFWMADSGSADAASRRGDQTRPASRAGYLRVAGQDPVKPKPSPEPMPAAPPGEKPPEQPIPQQPAPQQPAPAPAPNAGKERQVDLDAESIRIDSTLVVVPVSVTDQQGQPIRDLTAEEFILEEEGVGQQVQTLGDPGKTPLELALLFDVSRSVRNRFEFERTAAARFLEVVLKSGDFASIYLIGRQPHLLVERTGSSERAIAGVTSIEPTDEATAFFDTVVKAARNIEENASPSARRVLVVISDGEDNNSEEFLLRDALLEAQSRNCLFYAINPSGPSIRLNRMSIRGHEGMVRIANETGGMAFLPDRIDDLSRVFNHIATELQAQYLLGYYPSNDQKDGKFRKISVRIKNRPDLRIRARQGYYAPRE